MSNGSGVTVRRIMNDLQGTRSSQYTQALEKMGTPPRTVAKMVAAYKDGMQSMLADLVAMGVVEIVREESAGANGEQAAKDIAGR